MSTSEESRESEIRAELERKLEQQVHGQQRESAARLAFRRAAAFLPRFDPAELRPAGGLEVESSARHQLFDDIESLGRPGHSKWALRPDVRQATLQGLSGPEEALSVLAANPEAAESDLGRVIRSYLTGDAEPLEEQPAERLELSLRAVRWLSWVPGVESLPTEAEVQAAIEWTALLEPFRVLVQDGFEGRTAELDHLRVHVGVLQPVQLLARLSQTGDRLVRLFRRQPEMPLLVRGPGGIGKSTLIAKFILDHLGIPPERRFPFAYLDFERLSITALEPMSLIVEVCRQLAMQYPALAKQFGELQSASRAEVERQLDDDRELRDLRSLKINPEEVIQRSRGVRRNRQRRERRLLRRLAKLLRRASAGVGGDPWEQLLRDLGDEETRTERLRAAESETTDGLLRRIAAALGDESEPPAVDSTQLAEAAKERLDWLEERVRDRDEPLLLALQGFQAPLVEEEAQELVAGLALRLVKGPAPAVKLVLLDSGGKLPGQVRKQGERVVVGDLVRGAPLLLVLDSFERCQYRGALHLRRLFRLLDQLREIYPMLRLVISGRAAVPEVERKEPDLELTDFDPEAAVLYLEKRSQFDRQTAEELVAEYGGNPLTLNLLSRLGEEQPLDESRRREARRSGGWRLFNRHEVDKALIQAMLYERILEQLGDQEIRPLAHPGLVLRRITPEIIKEVLADYCKIDVPDLQEAERLFLKLERQVDLVERLDLDVLGHRPEVRRVMLKLLESDQDEMVRKIELEAVEYYRGRSEPQARAELIYHSLRLGSRPQEVNALWVPGVERFLGADAIEEVPAEARDYLTARLTGDVNQESAFYEDVVAQRVEGLLAEGMVEEALASLGDESEWSTASPLIALKAEALAASGRGEEASELVAQGILTIQRLLEIEEEPGDLREMLIRLRRLAAGFAPDRGTARAHLEEVARLSQQSGRGVDQLTGLFNRWQAGERGAELFDQLANSFLEMPREELRGHASLVAAIGGELGNQRPDVLLRAIELADWGERPGRVADLARELAFLSLESDDWGSWLVESARLWGFELGAPDRGRSKQLAADLERLLVELARSGRLPTFLRDLAERGADQTVLRRRLSQLVASTGSSATLDASQRARAFLAGEQLSFEEADALWRELNGRGELSLARAVLSRVRAEEGLFDRLPREPEVIDDLCRMAANLTSKDPELDSPARHDRGLDLLAERFDLEDPELDEDIETLGIAAAIHRRRWQETGELEDLRLAAELWGRLADGELGSDAYAQINSVWAEEMLAASGDDPEQRRGRARALRRRIVKKLPRKDDNRWNVLARMEAHVGLGSYGEALELVHTLATGPTPLAPGEIVHILPRLARLIQLREERPDRIAEVRQLFESVLGSEPGVVESALAGKLGLSLAGEGLRAVFFHLGVLAHLAERNALRQVEVLSCVSGGSIVGAAFWLELRRRLLESRPVERSDYLDLVAALISRFEKHFAGGGRQPELDGELSDRLDGRALADLLDERLYRPLTAGEGPLYMHQLEFTPADHATGPARVEPFDPRLHNILRAHKVPQLVINATTLNTGHGWQFTLSRMGEPPASALDRPGTLPRLAWSDYEPAAGWRFRLAEAVAASACPLWDWVPLKIGGAYEGIEVQLADGRLGGGVGSGALLTQGCDVVVISDAGGRLLLEPWPDEGRAAQRALTTLLERQDDRNELAARLRGRRLCGLMTVHLKAGLETDRLQPRFSLTLPAEPHQLLTPSGVRRDVLAALAELQTGFAPLRLEAARALMACGYRMARHAAVQDLEGLALGRGASDASWSFQEMLDVISSPGGPTPGRQALLEMLRGDGSGAAA